MSRTFAHSPDAQNVDTRRIRRPRYSDTRAAAQREARAEITESVNAR